MSQPAPTATEQPTYATFAEWWQKEGSLKYATIGCGEGAFEAGKRCMPSATAKLTDDQIMNAAITAADALDATRVNEMVPGGWKATTIFEGDTGLLRFGRLIEKAINGK